MENVRLRERVTCSAFFGVFLRGAREGIYERHKMNFSLVEQSVRLYFGSDLEYVTEKP
jgi:hypothetical protein